MTIGENSKETKLAEQEKHIDSIKLGSPEEAMKFILSKQSLMAFGGMDFANNMLLVMKLSIKNKKIDVIRDDTIIWIEDIVQGLIEVYKTRDVI